MIHQHYDPNQILWFLRNYWKFTRDGMIDEWHRVFNDTNFAKSQYSWLKSRYGMKEEWGASLNHPPFPGAKPGMPGTEDYEPPSVPTHPPRMTFRTRAESPTPKLVTAPAATPAARPIASGAGRGNNRHGMADAHQTPGMNPAFSANYQSYIGSSVQTPLATPAPTPAMPTGGQGAYNAAGRSNGYATTSHGTYAFGGLGSPFAATANMAPTGMNPIVSAFAQGTNPAIPANMGMFQQNAMSPPEAWALFQYQVPQQKQQQQQGYNQMGGDFANANADTNTNTAHGYMANDNVASGLGINHTGMPYYSSPHTMASQDMNGFFTPHAPASAPMAAPMATSMSMPGMSSMHAITGHAGIKSSGRRQSAPSYSNAKIIASVMRKHSPPTRTYESGTFVPQEDMGADNTGGKRKSSAVDIELNPPKRAKLASAPEEDGCDVQVVAVTQPADSSPPAETARPKTTKTRRKKKTTSSASSTSPSLPTDEKSIDEFILTLSPQSVSSGSFDDMSESFSVASTPAATAYATPTVAPAAIPTGTWYDGKHDKCRLDVRHRHDGKGIYIEVQEDDEIAVATSSAIASATRSPAQPATATFAVVPQAEASPEPSDAVNNAEPASSAAFDPVSTEAGADSETVDILSLPVPSQVEQPSAQSPAQAPTQVEVEIQAAVPEQPVPTEAPATTAHAEQSVEDLVRTQLAASLTDDGNASASLPSQIPGFPATQFTPLSGFPQGMMNLNINACVSGPSFPGHVFTTVPDPFASFAIDDNMNATQAYFSGSNFEGISFNNDPDAELNNDLFDMLDESQF